MKKHILDDLSGMGYHLDHSKTALTMCGRLLSPKYLTLLEYSDCKPCIQRLKKLVNHYAKLPPEDKPPLVDLRIKKHFPKMKHFVVVLDTCDERGIRSVNCYVLAENAAEAEANVIDWLQNIYHNSTALKIRDATPEEALSCSYWA